MEVGKTCCPPQRRVLSAIVQQAVAQLPRCLNSVELTRHDSAQGPSIWCQIGVKGGRFRRFCRFCRLLTTLPSITYVFYSSRAWKRSSVRSRSGLPIIQQFSDFGEGMKARPLFDDSLFYAPMPHGTLRLLFSGCRFSSGCLRTKRDEPEIRIDTWNQGHLTIRADYSLARSKGTNPSFARAHVLLTPVLSE